VPPRLYNAGRYSMAIPSHKAGLARAPQLLGVAK